MAALPPAAMAQLAAFIGAAIAGQVATQADVAAAVAPLTGQLAAVQAQLAAMQAQMQAQHAAMQAQMQAQLAQMQALLLPLNVPAFVAAATATVQSIGASRMQNAHDRSGEAYAVVQRSDGTPPPHWPAGFDRAALAEGPIAAIDTLLNDFGLPHGAPAATVRERRNALARHIGTMRM